VAYLEFASMITNEFTINELNMIYHVGINQINFNLKNFLDSNDLKTEDSALDYIFSLIEIIQGKFKDSVVQFFKNNYVLGKKHVFLACYFTQKAFYQKYNISNSKNIELLLYLSAKRQIKSGIDTYGISVDDLKSSKLTYCIMSPNDNLTAINKEICKLLNAGKIELDIDSIDTKKWELIKEFFEISNDQINIILKSIGKTEVREPNDLTLKILALLDLICEKMALLSIEKTKS
jgi:tRNA threonylcarbamoyladenosine modification (KEOPS) complex Cgi121 subunit